MEGSCHSLSWKCKCSALALMADCCISVSTGFVWKCKLKPLPVIYEISEEPATWRKLPGKILNSMKCNVKTTCSPGTMWHDFYSSFLLSTAISWGPWTAWEATWTTPVPGSGNCPDHRDYVDNGTFFFSPVTLPRKSVVTDPQIYQAIASPAYLPRFILPGQKS